MSDTTQSTASAPTRRSVNLKSSVKIQDVVNAKKTVANWAEDVKKDVVGYIHGFTNSIVRRTAPDGSKTYEGMAGQFEVVPVDPNEPAIQSGVCYLGDSFQPMITNLLKAQAGPDGRGQVTGVSFAFEIILQRAANPQGYTWVLEPLTEPEGLDPLADTRKLMVQRLNKPATHKAIEHKKEERREVRK